MEEKVFWQIRNHLINNLNWDYDYREEHLIKVDGIYMFKHFCTKERFPILCCTSKTFDAVIVQLERKLNEEVGAHLSLYQTFSKITIARLIDDELERINIEPPYFPTLNPFKFTESEEAFLTFHKVQSRINHIFTELA